MEVAAKLTGARLSAQKARLVADQIRGKGVEQALDTLAFSTKRVPRLLRKYWNLQLLMQNIMKVLMLIL